MCTYWLVGQEEYRERKPLKHNCSIQTPDVLRSVTRSSLRHNKINKFSSSRRLSLESQKRFDSPPSSPKSFGMKPTPNEIISCQDKSESGVELDESLSQQQDFSESTLPNRLLAKRNSCPCLGQNCDQCGKSKSEVFDFVTPRLVLEGTPSDELRQTSNLPQRNYPGWRRMSRFSSFVSCLGSGK
ncbi:atrial natriuretic peptide receptor 2 [Caerostris extrusa]|uniref:Atrial natriuretic peptide receptor 2 n=1 Tax=Caerostris extrusa TaxID=172846 RepID=A0AAV4RLX8_CAEEX|nr:atrial natriuretic peptide receptor 2 [Caerostris extrusa]